MQSQLTQLFQMTQTNAERSQAEIARLQALHAERELREQDDRRKANSRAGPRMPKAFDWQFSKEEITSNKLTLAVKNTDTELRSFKRHIGTKHPLCKLVCSASDGDWRETLGSDDPAEVEIAEEADAYVARQIMICLQKSLPRVHTFVEKLEKATLYEQTSGRFLLREIELYCLPQTSDDVDEIKARYDDFDDFREGMGKDAAVKAMDDCEKAFLANPWRPQNDHAVQQAILAKMPANPSKDLSHHITGYNAVILRVQLCHAQRREMSVEDARALELDMMKLTLAHALASKQSRSTHAGGAGKPQLHTQPRRSFPVKRSSFPPWSRPSADAATSTAMCVAGACADGHEGCAFDSCEADHDYEADAASGTCYDCGKEVGPGVQNSPHEMGRCPETCKKCGLGFCQNIRGLPCLVTGKERITMDTVIKNAVHRRIPQRLQKIMIKRQDEFLAKEREAQEAAKQAYAATLGVDPDELHADEGSVRLSDSVPPSDDELEPDEEQMLGGKLETEAPKPETLELMQPSQLSESDEPAADAANLLPVQEHDGQLGQWVWGLVDRGANVHLNNLAQSQRYEVPGSAVKVNARINGQGKGQSTSSSRKYTLPLRFENGKQLQLADTFDSPGSRKMLLDEQKLYIDHGIWVHTPTEQAIFPDGSTVKLHRRGSDHRLWLRFWIPVQDASVDVSSGAIEVPFDVSSAPAVEAASADAEDETELEASRASLVMVDKLVKAARYAVNADGLDKLATSVDGLDVKSLSQEERRLIDADIPRRMSVQKRRPAPQSNPQRTKEAGHTLAFDGWGPMQAPSVVGMCTYSLHCVDVASAEGIVRNTKQHQKEQWKAFVTECVRTWRARGAQVYYVKFDRAGEFTSGKFIEEIERDLNVTVLFAPAKWHEGVSGPECNNDILTRIGEALCARAKLGPRYILQARKHAQYLLNLRCLRGSSMSRREKASGVKVDVRKEKTYVFGCTVLVLRDADDRGPHGSLEKGRSYEARYLGRDGSGHVVEKLDTLAITYPSHVTPVDELEFVRDALPRSAALQSTEMQTDAHVLIQPLGAASAPQSAAPRNVAVLPPLRAAGGAATPDGDGMRISLPLGGHESTVDNVKQRVELRYPRAAVTIDDAKGGVDFTLREARTSYLRKLQAGEWGVVFVAMVCTTFSPCAGIKMRGKSKAEINGLTGLPPAISALLKKHNLLAAFVLEILEYCASHGIHWGAECAPSHGIVGLDTYWKEFADWGSFWDLPRWKELVQRSHAKSYLVARCSTEDPPTAQKYYQFYFSVGLQAAADEHMSGLECVHAWHAQLVRGKTDLGLWFSQQLEEYTPVLADRIARVLTSVYVASSQTAAAIPPYSAQSRGPNWPPSFAACAEVPIMTSVVDAIDDALMAHDGTLDDELDAAIAGVVFGGACDGETDAAEAAQLVDTCAPSDTATSASDTALALTKAQVAELVTALKVQDRSLTRQEVHRKIVTSGGSCTLSQVKRVKVGLCAAVERDRQRQQALDVHRRVRDMAAAFDVADASHDVESMVRIVEAAKATQAQIDVQTPLGKRVYTVPSSSRQVNKSPEKMYWIEADRAALHAILVRGNRLVRLDQVSQGTPIAPCVTARKMKLDQSTGELDKFKSRHAIDGARLAMLRSKLGLPPSQAGTCNIIDDMALKLLFADLAKRRRHFAKLDIGDAYVKGKRARVSGFMRMPDTIQEYDADGTPMVIEVCTPLWGEQEAGYEWDAELHERLLAIGWRQCEGVPAMYYFEGDGVDARLVKIVDDLGISESDPDQPIARATLKALKAAYDDQVTHDFRPSSFAGYKLDIRYSATACTVKLSHPQKIVEAARKYLPWLLDGSTPDKLVSGKALEDLLDQLALPDVAQRDAKLTKTQKLTQQIIGDLKYFERGSMPRITRMVHRLSCIMSHPPEAALLAASSVLSIAYEHRTEGITFGGVCAERPATPADGLVKRALSDGAPAELEVSADASTSPHDVYSVLITYIGAAILHITKKIGIAVGSTHDAENVATVKASELAIYARIVLAALGAHADQPTWILTDNLSNQRVAQRAQSAARSRYFLVRQTCLMQRIREGAVTVLHIPDPENPSDFLTKFIKDAKTRASIAYAAGAAH